MLYCETIGKAVDAINCKRLQESIANCVSCVHFLNEQILGEQKAKAVVQTKRLSSSWGDTCRRAYAKIRTPTGPRSAECWRGQVGGSPSQTLLSPWWRGQEVVQLADGEGRGQAVGTELRRELGTRSRGLVRMRREVRGRTREAASHSTSVDTSREGLVRCQGKLLVGRYAQDRHIGFPLA